MEDDLKYCKNKRCRRYQITVYAPGVRYCTECSAKLKKGWGMQDDDTPPLIEGSNTWHTQRREDNRMTTIPTSTPGNNGFSEMVSWQKFQGTHVEWLEYKAEFESGKFVNWTASGIHVGETKGNEDWTCADAEIEGCPISGRNTRIPRVRVTWAMYQRWTHLCKAFDTEWIAYLKGTKGDDGVYTITDMYFPKQKANGAHVTADDQTNQIQPDTVGSIHSHVSMGVFFSAEDKRHMNHDVEMICNRRGEVAIAVRIQLECGRNSRIECPILITDIPNVSVEEDIAALKAVISEERTRGFFGPPGNSQTTFQH